MKRNIGIDLAKDDSVARSMYIWVCPKCGKTNYHDTAFAPAPKEIECHNCNQKYPFLQPYQPKS